MSTKIYRFFIIGSSAAALHAAMLWALVEWLSLPPVYANPIAFLIAFSVSFSGQYLWTFGDRNLSLAKGLIRFTCVQLISGLIINQALFSFCVLQLQLPYMLALLISLIITAGFTYIASHFWAFTPTEHHD